MVSCIKIFENIYLLHISILLIIAFGAHHYKIPEQETQLKFYFSLQIFFLKTGSLLGRSISPALKDDIKCFGMDDCYPLGFGIPSIVMCFAFVFFLLGKSCYVQKPPSGNMLVKVFKCVLVRNIKLSFI